MVRDHLQRDPPERSTNKDLIRALNKALKLFPLLVTAGDGGMVLRAAREDALAGLSVVAELYDGSENGTLDRLKMAHPTNARVFFDRSKPATRRWCMSSLCGNRMKTRNYRERQRSAE